MKTLSRIYNTLIFIFLYAPIVVLIVFSFNNSKNRGRLAWIYHQMVFRPVS